MTQHSFRASREQRARAFIVISVQRISYLMKKITKSRGWRGRQIFIILFYTIRYCANEVSRLQFFLLLADTHSSRFTACFDICHTERKKVVFPLSKNIPPLYIVLSNLIFLNTTYLDLTFLHRSPPVSCGTNFVFPTTCYPKRALSILIIHKYLCLLLISTRIFPMNMLLI